jgi:hypothetical protein
MAVGAVDGGASDTGADEAGGGLDGAVEAAGLLHAATTIASPAMIARVSMRRIK